MRRIVTALVLVLSCLSLIAAPAGTDSLLQVLKTQAEDSNKVLTLNELFKANLYSDPPKAHAYAMSAYQLARKIQWDNGQAKMANNLGVYHSKQGQYAEALRYHDEVMAIRTKQGDKLQIANVHMNIGGVLYKQAEFEASLNRYFRAIEVFYASKDTAGVLASLNNIATVQREMGELPEAQAAYLNVMRMQEIMGNKREVARTAMNISGILHQQKQFDAAGLWLRRGLSIADSLGDNYLRANGLNSLAELLISQDSIQAARRYLDSSIIISVRIGDSYSEAFGYMLLSDVHVHHGDNIAAQEALQKSLTICQEMGRRQGEAAALARLGSLKVSLGQYKQAIEDLEAGLLISKEIDAPDMSRDILQQLGPALAANGDYKSAYERQLAFFRLNDSIYTTERSSKISEMHERYEAGQKQRIIDQQTLEHTNDELRIYRARQGMSLLLIVVFIATVVLGFFIYRFRQKLKLSREISIKNKEIAAQRDYAELQNLRILLINANLESLVEARTSAVVAAKHELDTFLYESAHALRRPITRIDGLIDLILAEKDTATAGSLRDRLNLTLRNMDGLLHKLIMVNEISTRALKPETIQLSPFISAIASEINFGDVQFHNRVAPQAECFTDAYFARTILTALIENAVAYHPADPEHKASVSVEVEASQGNCIFRVIDNGSGVPVQLKEKAYAMFVRGTVQGQGNGLGLYVSKTAADRIKAQLSYRDREGGGAIFELNCPALS